MDTCHYTFVKTHRAYDTESEPPCELRIVGASDMSLEFMDCHRCTPLLGDADGGGCCAGDGCGVHGKSLHPPLCFAVNLKPL